MDGGITAITVRMSNIHTAHLAHRRSSRVELESRDLKSQHYIPIIVEIALKLHRTPSRSAHAWNFLPIATKTAEYKRMSAVSIINRAQKVSELAKHLWRLGNLPIGASSLPVVDSRDCPRVFECSVQK
jgi:hypothetical protein